MPTRRAITMMMARSFEEEAAEAIVKAMPPKILGALWGKAACRTRGHRTRVCLRSRAPRLFGRLYEPPILPFDCKIMYRGVTF
jgi:hypothetical protein